MEMALRKRGGHWHQTGHMECEGMSNMCEEAAGGVFFRKSQISVKPSLREGPQCWIEKGGSFDYGEQSSIKL